MKAKRLNQSALACITKIHQTSISEYVNGKSIPSAAALALIADALGLSMDYLWGQDNGDNELSSSNSYANSRPEEQGNWKKRALTAESTLSKFKSITVKLEDITQEFSKLVSE